MNKLKAVDIAMKRSVKLKPTLWDGLVAALVIALGVFIFAALRTGVEQGGTLTAVVYADGVELERLTLAQKQVVPIQIDGYTLELVVENGEVWIAQADCPTQDCVRTGHIHRAGESIVCLPARVSVRLTGQADDTIDAVLG